MIINVMKMLIIKQVWDLTW